MTIEDSTQKLKTLIYKVENEELQDELREAIVNFTNDYLRLEREQTQLRIRNRVLVRQTISRPRQKDIFDRIEDFILGD